MSIDINKTDSHPVDLSFFSEISVDSAGGEPPQKVANKPTTDTECFFLGFLKSNPVAQAERLAKRFGLEKNTHSFFLQATKLVEQGRFDKAQCLLEYSATQGLLESPGFSVALMVSAAQFVSGLKAIDGFDHEMDACRRKAMDFEIESGDQWNMGTFDYPFLDLELMDLSYKIKTEVVKIDPETFASQCTPENQEQINMLTTAAQHKVHDVLLSIDDHLMRADREEIAAWRQETGW